MQEPPHIHDVAKNLYNVTKNKVMELRMEALSFFPDACSGILCWHWKASEVLVSGRGSGIPPEPAAAWPLGAERGERGRGTARSLHRHGRASPPGAPPAAALFPGPPAVTSHRRSSFSALMGKG